MHSRLLSTFSSIKFNVAGFIVRSLSYLYLNFVHEIVMILFALFYMSTSSYAITFVEDAFSVPLYTFNFFVKNQVFIDV